jgi:hypothetical protein
LILILNPSSGPQRGETITLDSANTERDKKYNTQRPKEREVNNIMLRYLYFIIGIRITI